MYNKHKPRPYRDMKIQYKLYNMNLFKINRCNRFLSFDIEKTGHRNS